MMCSSDTVSHQNLIQNRASQHQPWLTSVSEEHMDCDMEDCSNRGTCSGNKKYFACLCFKPYYGRRCEYEYVEVDHVNLLAHIPKGKTRALLDGAYEY
ncbi:unnamed protein product [Gongylonema pulchrum]|uniref:EGF-like domain-containing protein n=1 Tax=Gongylonema pulchrum TaxID=637853 RepID=A0A183E485_9BILA|nr:unnamed protein product [Gongylonema pulchrum]